MDGPSGTGEQQRLQKLLAQNRRALRAEQQRLRRGIAQKLAANRYCAESAVAVQTKILNYRRGVAPPATWAYETFSDLMASGAREVPKQKTARQRARRWRARWGAARKTLPAHEDLSQGAVQEKAWF